MDVRSELSVTDSRADVGWSNEMGCILIGSPVEMANMLLSASPAGAAEFARKMHERACYSQTDERMDFWLSTMEEIAGRGR